MSGLSNGRNQIYPIMKELLKQASFAHNLGKYPERDHILVMVDDCLDALDRLGPNYLKIHEIIIIITQIYLDNPNDTDYFINRLLPNYIEYENINI